MKARTRGSLRRLADWAQCRTPAQLAAPLALALLFSTLPVFVNSHLNPLRQGAAFYYDEAIRGEFTPEQRRIRGSWLGDRKSRVSALVGEYLQGPRNFRLRHPGAVTLAGVLDQGEVLSLFLKPAGPVFVSPESRLRLREGLLRTLRSNHLAAPEMRVYWAGEKLDPI